METIDTTRLGIRDLGDLQYALEQQNLRRQKCHTTEA